MEYFNLITPYRHPYFIIIYIYCIFILYIFRSASVARLGRANNRHMVVLRAQIERDIGGIQQKHAAALASGEVFVIETFLPMTQEQA